MDVNVYVHGLEKLQEQIVKDSLMQMNGVEGVDIHSKIGMLKISYTNDEITLEKICEALEQQGLTIEL